MLYYVWSHLIYNSQKIYNSDLPQQMNRYRKCGIFTQWISTQLLKSNDFMKFAGKCMELENIILSNVTQSQKNTHDKWILGEKIQLTNHIKLKKMEDQSVDASVLLRRGKTIMGG